MHDKEYREKRIQKLEPMIDKVENDEYVAMKSSYVIKEREYLENKFLKLREVASTNKVTEIYENYETLQNHIATLELTAAQYNRKIDSLTQERNKMTVELNEICLNHEFERKVNPKDFDEIEKDLKNRNKLMDENERILNDTGIMMGKICGCVTRLSLQLLGNTINIDVKPRNVDKYFNKCLDKIEEKVSFIFRSNISKADMKILSEKFPLLMNLLKNHDRKSSELRVFGYYNQ